MHSPNFPVRLLALTAACVAAAACGDASADRGGNWSNPRLLAWSEVEPLKLEKVGTLPLGGAGGGFVNDVADIKRFNGQFYVLDRFDKSIKVFDAGGRFVRQIGRKGRGPGEFTDPFEIAFAGDRMYVADPGQGKAISVFDLDGRFVRTLRPEIPRTPTSIAAEGDRLLVLTPAIQSPEREGWQILTVAGTEGEALARGCTLDGRYVASQKEHGMLHRNQYGRVSAHGGRVYCIQTASPVVQVLDADGRAVDTINVAPPFYRAPVDRPFLDNSKAIFDFLSSFTIHSRFYPVDGGFVSVYNRYSIDDQEMKFSMMLCADGRGRGERRCGVAEDVGRPVMVPALDTLYVLDEVGPSESARLSVYHVVGLRAAEEAP